MGDKDATVLRWSIMSRLMVLARFLFRCFGVFCILLASTLIGTTLYVYFHSIVPLLVDVRSSVGVIFFIPCSWLSFNIIFNYAMVVFTHPGRPAGVLTDEEVAEMQREAAPVKGKGWSKFCKHCKVPKPPRAHHCHVCGKCILKMDHHCPWINACVGHYNHRYFLMFILYLGLSSLYGSVTLLLHYFGLLASNHGQDEGAFTSAFIFTFALCSATFLAMLMFFAWNAYLIITNQTTIEYHYNQGMKEHLSIRGEVYVNPYNVGLTRNLLQVFGPFSTLWALLLPSYAKLPGDGTKWLTIHDTADNIV